MAQVAVSAVEATQRNYSSARSVIVGLGLVVSVALALLLGHLEGRDAAGAVLFLGLVLTAASAVAVQLALVRGGEEVAQARAVFESASLGMAYLGGEDHRVVTANPALAAMLGVTPDALCGVDLLALITGGAEVPPIDSTSGDQFRVTLPDAMVDWVRVSISGGGETVIAVVEDISDSKAIEAELKHIDRLSQLGELAASLAHEIGQPLNVIRLTAEGALDRLDAGVLDIERQKRSLAVVLDQSRRLQEMIDHTLSYSRRIDQPCELFDPRPVIASAIQLVAERARSGNIRLVWTPPAETASLFGHAVRLEQVLTNLLTNACDAILAGGIVPAEGEPCGTVQLSSHFDQEAGQMVISVVDDGPGVPASVLEHLFQPFFTTKPKGKGTGLGLSVSLGIVAEMGGSIQVSNQERGARFDILLPAQELLPDAVAPPQPMVGGSGVGGSGVGGSGVGGAGCPHLLVVDDEPLAVAEIASFLTDYGYRVSTAPSGNTALASYGLDPAALVMTDLNMPDGDGVTLIRSLKRDNPSLPVIAFTVRAGEVPGQALAAGADLVLPKPLRLAEIHSQIQRLLAPPTPTLGE